MYGVYKELTRHRHASFSIESTRYCNYGKDKFDNELKFIKPRNIDENSDIYGLWYWQMKNTEDRYLEMSAKGATPDQMRMILPHSTAAEVVMTCNIREWRHIMQLRCSNRAHPTVQQLLIPLLLKFKETMPVLFNDIEYNINFPKEKYATITVRENEY